jgi:hypothetical protein
LFYDLYGFRRSSSGANGLNVWKFIKKWSFFGFSQKNQLFLITAQFFCFFRFIAHIQTKKISTCRIVIAGMFAENLVEVGFVWWIDSGIIFFRIHQKNIQPKSCALFLLATFVLRVFEISGFSWAKTWKYRFFFNIRKKNLSSFKKKKKIHQNLWNYYNFFFFHYLSTRKTWFCTPVCANFWKAKKAKIDPP